MKIEIPASFHDEIRIDGISLNQEYPTSEFMALRRSFKDELQEFKYSAPQLYGKINDLYYWYYRPLLLNLHRLRQYFIENKSRLKENPNNIQVLIGGQQGILDNNYSACTSKGDESRAILYYPERLWPRYIEKALSDVLPSPIRWNKAGLIDQFLYVLRNYFLWCIKFTLIVIQIFKAKNTTQTEQANEKNPDLLFIVRSRSQLESITPFCKKLLDDGIKIDIFYDPSLHETFLSKKLSSPDPRLKIIWAPHLARWGVIRALLSLLFKNRINQNLTENKQFNINLTFNGINFQEDLTPLNNELIMTSGDLKTHQIRLAKQLANSTYKCVLTAEMVSPYLFAAHSVVEQYSHVKFFNYQTFASPPDHSLQMTEGHGILVQSEYFREKFLEYFPEEHKRCHNFGQFTHISTELLDDNPQDSFNSSSNNLEKVIFFTQPYDHPVQLEIIYHIIEILLQSSAHQTQFTIKLHPRDHKDTYASLIHHYQHQQKQHQQQQANDESSKFRLILISNTDQNTLSNSELIKENHLTVSRTSSVLREALLLNKPYLACLLSSLDKQFQGEYLSEKLGVRCTSLDELKSKIAHFHNFKRDYSIRRQSFMQSYYRPFDLHSARQQLGLD